MRKILLILSIILLASFFYLITSKPIPHVEKEIIEYYDQILIPVTKLTSSKIIDDFETTKFLTIKSNESFLPEIIKAEIIEDADLEEAITDEEIVLLTPEQVKPTYKTLTINENNPWRPTFDSKNYIFQKQIPTNKDLRTPDWKSKFRIFVGGEIIPARAVDHLNLNKNNNYTYLFDFYKKDIQTADLAITMLENPVNGDPSPCTGCTTFVADERNVKGFADVGFDFIATSGNHMGDGGQAAYKRTEQLMKENNIQATGSGRSEEELLKPAIKEVNGFRIGMISADDVAFFYWKLDSDPSRYGTNTFSKRDNQGILSVNPDKVAKISEIKSSNNIDYMIVYESWGIEYTNQANEHQRELAHAFIDNGADLVIASHPHWVQNIEFYKETPIFYSLGNFIFDQTHTLETRQAVNLNLYFLDNELKSIEFMPNQVCGYHQTPNDRTNDYLKGNLSLEDIYNLDETKECVYWQPKKLKPDHPRHNQVLERMFEFTKLE